MLDETEAPIGEKRSFQRRWRKKGGLIVPTAEAVALDLARVPPDQPWDWAAPRLVALIRGARVPVLDEETLDSVGFEVPEMYATLDMPPGVSVSFVVSLGVASLNVTPSMMDRWGVTIGDVAAHGLAGLRRQVGLAPRSVQVDASAEGWPAVRSLKKGAWWAASLPLLPDRLMAIFGSHDQIFLAPYSCLLLSVPIETDLDVAADLLDLYGLVNPVSLLVGLPAFVLRDRVLSTERLPEWLPGEDSPDLADLDADEPDPPGTDRPY